MADRAITALTAATSMSSDDLFAISQGGQAKKVSWATFYQYLQQTTWAHGGISNISYTAPSSGSLNGTITITMGDNTTSSFTITNGRGITSIAKTSTSGLVDTYTISYNNATTSTFTVTNGKSITSITDKWAVSSSNSTVPSTWYNTMQTMTTTNKYLWHYQIIAYNNSTTSETTKTVVGVYGDTGQAWYVWIKYSANQPTQDSDMGNVPDNWIGVYSGTASTAPTTYTSYSWFEIKGEKGDTGEASEVDSTEVVYQWGQSATTAPGGSWTTTIPTRPDGYNFLWTRVTVIFNDSTDVVWYSVGHYGEDGQGAVSTVNAISPINGNVTLLASDISASDNASIQTHLTEAEGDISTIQGFIGDATLQTTAQTITEAINEHESGKVSKSGDTITGNTTIANGGSPTFALKNTVVDSSSDTPSANVYQTIAFTDKNDLFFGYIQTILRTTGQSAVAIAARKRVNGTDVTNGLQLYVNADGTQSISVNNPAAWRSALGVGGLSTVSTSNLVTSNLSLANNTWTQCGGALTFQAGTWLVICGARFSANGTGKRGLCLSTSVPSVRPSVLDGVVVGASPNETTDLMFSKFIQVSANTTYYLSAIQQSGAALNLVDASVQFIKLCN